MVILSSIEASAPLLNGRTLIKMHRYWRPKGGFERAPSNPPYLRAWAETSFVYKLHLPIPGFGLSESTTACVCEPKVLKSIQTILQHNKWIRKSNLWFKPTLFGVGYDKLHDGILLHCPFDYCVFMQQYFLSTIQTCSVHKKGQASSVEPARKVTV